MSVRERFSTLHERFRPERAKNIDIRLQFILEGKDGGEWFVEIKNGKLTVKEGKGKNPTTTMRASADNYRKFVNGEMNRMVAIMTGKIRVSGDMFAFRKFSPCFED